MTHKLLSSPTLRALVIVFAMIASSSALLAQAPQARAQSAVQQGVLTIGMTNDMVNTNFWDPATNSVWKAYQVEWNFETLFSEDPDFATFPWLADPARGGTACAAIGAGYSGDPSVPGYCLSPNGLEVTVYLRSGVHFSDGTPLTTTDVVFSFQAMPWSTESTGITSSIWWSTPKVPLWAHYDTVGTTTAQQNSLSHVGVAPGNATMGANSVTFYLAQPYALFFSDTMFDSIIPEHIWKNHLQSTAPINYSDPNLGPITDTQDRSISFAFGGATDYLQSTVGTGAFKMAYWLHNSNATIVVDPNYWGKNVASASHVWKSKTYPFYPLAVKTINFLIFGSLDVLSLALQKGEIDTLLSTSITPGVLGQFQSNPQIGISTNTDSGYFYMAFNLRESPWNDLCLRQAISMTIDKAYIVNTLLGGFGTAGSVPIGITNSAYVNTSAAPVNNVFDLTGAATKLDGCGYHVNTATGFRTTPTGAPIVASILAPPKDYDPVRADAAIMISNNLKSIGLDIDAAPTSFDTIVTKAFTAPVSFQMYILGWSLGDFPETYMCNFFCSNQDPNINPAGANSPGYRNPTLDTMLAQASVTIDTTARIKIIKDAEGILTRDIPWNVLYYRKAISVYRTDTWSGWIPVSGGGSGNLGVYNWWSLSTLGATPIGVPSGSHGTLQVALTIPDQVFARETAPIDIYVAQNQAPAALASVAVNISYGSVSSVTSLTTDGSGHATMTWPVPVIQGNVLVAVNATKGGVSGTNAKIMEVTIGPPLPSAQLLLSTTTPVIHPSNFTTPNTPSTATIKATLVTGGGVPIVGARVFIDKKLLAGTVSPLNTTTDATGVATFTYTAPGLNKWPSPNSHVIDIVKATTSVANTVVGATQAASLTMYVQNDAAPDWLFASVNLLAGGVGGTGLVVSPAVSTSTVTVKVTDWAGAAVGGIAVDPIVSDPANLTVTPATTDITSTGGLVIFNVAETAAAQAGPNNTNVWVRFAATNQPYATSDQLLFLVSDGTATGYAARETFTTLTMPFSTAFAENNATVTVYNRLGAPASGVPVFFQIDYGPLGVPAQFPYTYDYGTPEYNSSPASGANLDMNEAGGGSLGGVFQNSTGQGVAYGVENWFNDWEIENDFPNFATGETYDACNPAGDRSLGSRTASGDGTAPWPAGFNGEYFFNATSVTGVTGTYTAPFFALPHRLDSAIQVRAFISKPGAVAQAISNLWTSGGCNFAFDYANAMRIDSGVVSQRAPMFGLGSVKLFVPKYTNTPGGLVPTNNPDTTKPVTVFSSQQSAVTLSARFYALNGASPGVVQVMLVRGAGSAARDVLGTGSSLYCFGTCTLKTNKPLAPSDGTGYLNRTFTTPIFSLSQYLEFTWVNADPSWAFGGREQLFSGCTAPCSDPAGGNEFGDYWLTPTFTSLIAKTSNTVDIAYMYLATSTAFMTVHVNSGVLAPGQQGSATATVYSILTGAPIAGASVWSGNQTVVTDSTGSATFTFYATTLGAVETLITATTPYGGSARGWFGYIASLPVLSFGTVVVTKDRAGNVSTIATTATNTLAVAGTVTVWLYVSNVNGTTLNPVAAQEVTFTASQANVPVSFSWVFAKAGAYQVAIGSASAVSVTILPAITSVTQTGPTTTGIEPLIAYALAGGLLVVGIVAGVVVGMMLRRRKPPTMPSEAEKPDEAKPAEEELGPGEQL